jgi:hypothetical protein
MTTCSIGVRPLRGDDVPITRIVAARELEFEMRDRRCEARRITPPLLRQLRGSLYSLKYSHAEMVIFVQIRRC